MKIVCFGDSITGEKSGEPYLHNYLKWLDILGALLEVTLTQQVTVLNRGYAGDSLNACENCPGASNRLEREVLAEQPDIAIVLLGANDAGLAKRTGDADAEKYFEANFNALVARLKNAGILVLLLQYHQVCAANDQTAWHHGPRFNAAIARVGATQSVPIVAMEPAFADARERYADRELLDELDGIHLRPAGELVYAKAVFRALQSEFSQFFS